MKQAFIVSAVRTAIGKFGGSLKNLKAGELGKVVVKEAVARSGFAPEEIEEVIMGNVLSGGQGMNVARQSALYAGLPERVPCFAVNKVCGSGLKSVALAAQAIRAEDADVVVAGGVESMSTAPYALPAARWGVRMGDSPMIDLMITDGLTDIFHQCHMGITAENLVEKYQISRQEQDEFSARSQQKAEKAIKEGKFKEEIVPVEVPQKKGETVVFDTDEFPRFGTAVETISKLKPAFKKDGTVTAANASGINDGAACVVVASEEKVKEKGLKPLARIVAYAQAGVDPRVMGIGPVPAIRKVLEKAQCKLEDIDLIELNEAFAAQSIAVLRELNIPEEKLNVNGGAIALGHPIGCSGTRILVTLLYEMKRRHLKRGLAALCIGGGMGIAMIVER